MNETKMKETAIKHFFLLQLATNTFSTAVTHTRSTSVCSMFEQEHNIELVRCNTQCTCTKQSINGSLRKPELRIKAHQLVRG